MAAVFIEGAQAMPAGEPGEQFGTVFENSSENTKLKSAKLTSFIGLMSKPNDFLPASHCKRNINITH